MTTKTVRTWSEDSYEALQGCFEVTDWNVLCEPFGENIDGLTECITDYIYFCVDSIVPARTMRYNPKNKPWVTKDIKAILNQKKRAFSGGNREELRDIQREPNNKIKEAKEGYRRKLERKLQQNNMREFWSGMRTITGFRRMEDVLPRSSAKDAAAQQSLELLTGGTDISYHEDPGETCPGAAQAYGQAAPGSPPVRLPAPDWS